MKSARYAIWLGSGAFIAGLLLWIVLDRTAPELFMFSVVLNTIGLCTKGIVDEIRKNRP